MTIIPNQFFGLGDVIFCMSLVNIIADGRPVIWPVLPQFVEGLNRAYPHVKFIDKRTLHIDYDRRDQYECDIHGIGRCTVLPLRWADVILKVPYTQCMRAKYDMYGLDFEIWREGAVWVRYSDREYALLGTSPLEYVVNRTFGSDGIHKVNIPQFRKQTEIMPSSKWSLFDWALVLINAWNIHTVNTSIIYLLELLDLKAPEIHLYQRSIPGQTFETIDYILKRHHYIFHP